MNVGDIVLNVFAGAKNPGKYSVFIGEDEKFFKTLSFDHDGAIKILRFNKRRQMLKVLCHSGAFDTLKDDLDELREVMTDVNQP